MKSKMSNLTLPLLVASFNTLLILFPAEVLEAAREGIGLWFNNVFPALLPFIIGTNLLTGLGFISFLGTLLTPVMVPVFGVPGCGGFALAAGMASGYPIGAKITGELRESKELTRTEAQRLLSFVNNSGPLFILGVVGIGMFRSKEAGYLIMAAHYGGAIITGLLFKYYKSTDSAKKMADSAAGYSQGKAATRKKESGYSRLMSKAMKALRNAKQKDGRNFGQLLGDSVKNAMEAVIQVGGFIILFCVIVRVLEVGDFFLPEFLVTPILSYFHMDMETCKGLVIGLIEITNGAKILSGAEALRLPVIIAAGIISFGGFSVHAQSISFISKTDIKISVYLFSKMVHGIISIILCILLYPFFHLEAEEAVAASSIQDGMGFLTTLFLSSAGFLGVVLLILAFCIIYNIYTLRKDTWRRW